MYSTNQLSRSQIFPLLKIHMNEIFESPTSCSVPGLRQLTSNQKPMKQAKVIEGYQKARSTCLSYNERMYPPRG